ncbi:hypothetical protein Prudu_009147 [Prunus dulcis]|uniref:Uncharacterized protein n=1 Tax=Prunus dulcis TaxID=3755 RepID=A0A4Y1R5K9_PRUDU|nr:hypothetical protein Prudu_009147 [Prunus dulcis]
MGSRGKLTLSNCVRDTSFRREGADIHVDVGLCITQIGITREAPTKARLELVMSFHLEMLWGNHSLQPFLLRSCIFVFLFLDG